MYQSYFGLEQKPFSLTPNTSLYFGLPPHEEALELLRVALTNGEGVIKITGEVGTGKTMVLRMLLSHSSDDFEFVYIPNPILSPGEFKIAVAKELDIVFEDGINNLSVFDAINEKLLELFKQNKKVVLVIDEAQSLREDTLEAIRLLGNLETESEKIVHIVLFGQSELDEMLQDNALRQFNQRISFCLKLRTLDSDETYAYLNYRMRAAGYKGGEIFSKNIANYISNSCMGVPRIINIVANKCLMLAYGYGDYAISKSIAREAIKDTPQANTKHFKLDLNFVLMMLIAVVTVACLYLLLSDRL